MRARPPRTARPLISKPQPQPVSPYMHPHQTTLCPTLPTRAGGARACTCSLHPAAPLYLGRAPRPRPSPTHVLALPDP